ncbi:MAG: PrgI family protein [Patescibacteria group bacterium]
MSQYQVPQFIDIEDKVFGPLTIKQFLYIFIGAIPVVLIYMFFKGWVLFVLGVPIAIFVGVITFYKPNGVPMPKVVRNFLSYALSNKLYLWKKKAAKGSVLPEDEIFKNLTNQNVPTPMQQKVPYVIPPKFNQDGSVQNKRGSVKLEDLAWNLDVQPDINTNNPQIK